MTRFSPLALLVLVSSCVSLPGTDKKAYIIVPESQEVAMGLEAFKEIKEKEKISKDARLNAILQRVGKRIAAVSPVNYKWEFVLIESKEMNAFCLPGGKVAFYTGILPVLQNEAAMAIVMGHEIGHAVMRHAGQRMSQALTAQGLMLGVGLSMEPGSKTRDLVLAGMGIGAQVGVMLPFSRAHETESDSVGLRYAADAGYDPSEGARFWSRFAQATQSGGNPPTFLSTHPSSSSRIENLKRLQKEVQSTYEKSPKYGLGETL